MRRVKVRIAGKLVHTMIGCKDVDFAFRRPYGCWEASFQALIGDGWRHPDFVEGALFEVFYGGDRRWFGVLQEPNWATGEMTGMGMIRILERYRARYSAGDGTLLTTWNPRTAIDDIISPNILSGRVAVPILRDNSVPDVDLAKRDPEAEPMQLLDLLDLATARGYGAPSIAGDGVLRFLPDPTVRTWTVHPRVVDMGNTGGEDAATRVWVIYTYKTGLAWDAGDAYAEGDVVWWGDALYRAADTVPPGYMPGTDESAGIWDSAGSLDPWLAATSYDEGEYVTYNGYIWEWTDETPDPGVVPDSGTNWTPRGQIPFKAEVEASNSTIGPYREAPEIDARDLGAMTMADAQALADAALAEALKPAYTSDIDVTPTTVTGRDGTPIVIVGHEAGELGRVNGVSDPRLGQPFIEPISAEYQVNGADSDYPTGLIKVVGKEARNYTEVIQAVIEARRREAKLG